MNNFRVLQRALLFVISGAFLSPQLAHADVDQLIGKLTDLKSKLGELSDALSLKPAKPRYGAATKKFKGIAQQAGKAAKAAKPVSADDAREKAATLIAKLDKRIAHTTKNRAEYADDDKKLEAEARAEKIRDYANNKLLPEITDTNYIEMLANIKQQIDLANAALAKIAPLAKTDAAIAEAEAKAVTDAADKARADAQEKLTANEDKIVSLIKAIDSKDEDGDRTKLATAQDEYKNAFVNYVNLKAYNYFEDIINTAIQWTVVAEAANLEAASWKPNIFKGSTQTNKEKFAKNYSAIVYNQQFALVLSKMTKGQAQDLQGEINAGTNQGIKNGIEVVTEYGKDKSPRYLNKTQGQKAAANAAKNLSALIDTKMSSLKD